MTDAKIGTGRRKFIGSAIAGAAITGFPHIARAQAKVIRVGMPTILSGRVATLGTSSRAAAQLAFKQINDAGGINGRKFELIDRDSKGRPDEAAKIARDLVNNDGCVSVCPTRHSRCGVGRFLCGPDRQGKRAQAVDDLLARLRVRPRQHGRVSPVRQDV